MKVSIIVPVYNSEKYLRECIDSTLNQTYSDIEVIAVDDGSKDNSLKILDEYTDKIKVIKKENNTGSGSAINIGMTVMNGEWVKLLSGDDVLKKNAIEILTDEARKIGKKSENYLFYTNYEMIDACGDFIQEIILPNYNTLTNFEKNVVLLDHFDINLNTIFLHKSLFDRFGLFNEKIGEGVDLEFWLRCCLLHGCTSYLIPKNTLKYRIHKEQTTQKTTNEIISRADMTREEILKQLSLEVQETYRKALQKYKHRFNLKMKKHLRKIIRSVMFKIFSERTCYRILKKYSNGKEWKSGINDDLLDLDK